MLAVMLSIVEDFPDYQFVMQVLKSGVFFLWFYNQQEY
jgi:hypothetical protein